MAYMKIVERGNENKYTDLDAYYDLISYWSCDPLKVVATGFANVTSIEQAAEEMEQVTRRFKKAYGKKVSHIIITFAPEELKYRSNESIQWIAEACMRYYADRYQVVYGIHNYPRPHIHMIFNRISFLDGKKYPDRYEDRDRFWVHVYRVLANYNIRLWK